MTTVQTKAPGGRKWLLNLGIAIIVIYCLVPFYWMIVSAFRRPNGVGDNSPVPSPWSLGNFDAVFQPSVGFWRSLVNSLVVAGATTLLKLFTDIQWINSYQALILPDLSFALPLAVWTLATFFRQMPKELEEAAMVDGLTRGQAFRKVILPLAAPGMFTTAIITFIAAWNEFIIALTMVNEKDIQVATVTIAQFTGASGYDSPFGTKMAAGVIVTVPLVVVVLIFQRRIIAGLTAGGVK